MANGINSNKSTVCFFTGMLVFYENNRSACRLLWFYKIGPSVEIFYHFVGLVQFSTHSSNRGTKNTPMF